ncbi:MAG: hypothetical protein LBK60_06170 [Verrucomicrobiales bacterium]|jgi:hypothetical protein|nr:hypothetical protein [Verrucomicrobiales bacterium]
MNSHYNFAAYVPTTADGRHYWALDLLEYVGNNQATFTSVPKEVLVRAEPLRRGVF